jgi:hypothetical protein
VNGNPNNSSGLSLTFGLNSALPQWPLQSATNDIVLQIGNHTTPRNGTIFAASGVYAYCDLQDAVVPFYSYTPRCAPGLTLASDFKTCG